VLDSLHLLDTHSEIAGILENVPEEFRPFRQVAGKLIEQLEELCFMGYEPHGFPLQNKNEIARAG
jgi:hypothetical protein